MNILPKKRWHVRTKDNIARVRKDEAEAAEKERQEKLRIDNADREARLNILKQKRKLTLQKSGVDSSRVNKIQDSGSSSEHINLFTDIEHTVKLTNRDHDNEEKEKKEEYEKKIGYLTYLGQDTNEVLKKKNWYEVPPESRFSPSSNIKDTYEKLVLKDQDGNPKKQEIDVHKGELDWKLKQLHDPIKDFRNYCKSKEMNPKTGLKKSQVELKILTHNNRKDKELKLQKLREARLKREQQEKYKADLLLSGIHSNSTHNKKDSASTIIKPKYNSQFNPELARQNFS